MCTLYAKKVLIFWRWSSFKWSKSFN